MWFTVRLHAVEVTNQCTFSGIVRTISYLSRYSDSLLLLFFRSHLEASSDQWKRLHLSLQELVVWLQLKDDELCRQAPVGGDFPAVQKQNDVHRVGYF